MAALVALSFIAAPANASVFTFFTLAPPAKYDKMPFKTPVKVYRLPIGLLQKICQNNWAPLGLVYGCAWTWPKHCNVFIPESPVINVGFPLPPIPVVTPEMILEHELAHCAGWPRNHPHD